MRTLLFPHGSVHVSAGIERGGEDVPVIVVGRHYQSDRKGPGFSYAWFESVEAFDQVTLAPVELTDEERTRLQNKLLDKKESDDGI